MPLRDQERQGRWGWEKLESLTQAWLDGRGRKDRAVGRKCCRLQWLWKAKVPWESGADCPLEEFYTEQEEPSSASSCSDVIREHLWDCITLPWTPNLMAADCQLAKSPCSMSQKTNWAAADSQAPTESNKNSHFLLVNVPQLIRDSSIVQLWL